MPEIALVTAYFNIGRDNWPGFNRGDDKYLGYFSHWARLRNQLIVYTTPDISSKVMDIRRRFGLEKQTTVISIADIATCVPDIYAAIKKTMKNKDSWLFHKKLNHPESWNYLYNYMTGIKSYFVQDAIEKKLATGTVAWIDFSYDHGGEEFPYSEDFDFLWSYDFEPKIHLFLAKELDDTPIFKIVQTMDTYIRGGIVVAPAPLWKSFWEDSRRAIQTLADCGLADDDQTITLMAYRKHPNHFKNHLTTYWGEALRAYGGEQIRLRPPRKKKTHALHQQWKQYIKEKKEAWDIRKRHGQEIKEKYFSE